MFKSLLLKKRKRRKKRKYYISSSGESSSSDTDSEPVNKRRKKTKKKKSENNDQIQKQKNQKTKWNNDEISRLIDLYEARPCLWDVFTSEHHNREATSKAKAEIEVGYIFRVCFWEKKNFGPCYYCSSTLAYFRLFLLFLKNILSRPWQEISSQLTSLRQILGQNIKKNTAVKSGQGTDELFTPTWIFWDSLQFLVPVMHARQSKDTMKKADSIDDLVGNAENNDSAKDQEPVNTPATKSQTKKKPRARWNQPNRNYGRNAFAF